MQIDIVIPNFNGKVFLQSCLESLEKQSVDDFTVFVVDNGSGDGSVDFLRENYPETKIIAWAENKGFSAAVNAGIHDGSAPLVFLLNNDTELDENCLEELLTAARIKPEYDFFAAKMLNYHDHTRLDGAGDAFMRGGVGYKIGTMEADSSYYSTARQVFGACAGAALYRRELFEEIGCFDEDFFAYLEDVDFNFRANSRGKKCWYVPKARVYHIGSATTGSKINEFTVSLSTRNNLCLLVKNYPVFLFFRFLPAICVYQFFWFCFVVKKVQVFAYCKGLVNFLKVLPLSLAKRKGNLLQSSLNENALAAVMRSAEKEATQSIMRRRQEKGKGNLFFSCYQRLFL
ncbi:MAG TPA: glycosyltransferase family 2 protein [Desulfobacterales bacterium]|nr:glycosyltransferase family 2 protein [Desulfobacterales bacterium]